MKHFTVALVGNPNCGKTTLFNALTGSNQKIGNWPGVTVEKKEGSFQHNEINVKLIDLPGIYSLNAGSVDEQVARDFLIQTPPNLIVNIIDASNINRNLYLTSQLAEMKIPVIAVLNMMDIAKSRQIKINTNALQEALDCPVVELIASKKAGVDSLKDAISEALTKTHLSIPFVKYPDLVEDVIATIQSRIEGKSYYTNPNWLAIKLLEQDETLTQQIEADDLKIVKQSLAKIEDIMDEDSDIIIANSRYESINKISEKCVIQAAEVPKTLSDKIDKVVLNRIFGLPVFLFAMYTVFMLTINLGGAFIDFFDILFGTIFVDGTRDILSSIGTPELLVTILSDGIGGGIQTIATFIPPIGFMFLCLSLLESSGYMSRAAFVMDRFMRFVGLPGKSFVPMLVGFGCTVPAIMATRTLENQRDRLLTIMMNPFMSCGARLPVYAVFAAAFFPHNGQNLVFLLYLIGIGFAVVTGLILKSTVLKGDITPFIMELPPYHIPTIGGMLVKTWDRLKSFILRAGKVIIPVVLVLSLLNSLGTDGSFGNEDGKRSILSSIGKSITPIFKPMGISEQNWPATVSIFTGIFAKEAVVGTLDSLYSQIVIDEAPATEGENVATEALTNEKDEPFSLKAGISEAFASVGEGLSGVLETATDPLGINIGDVSDTEAIAQEQGVNNDTFKNMIILFGSTSAAFAFLLFTLMYFPCVAAIAAVYRETNLKWTVFVGVWTTTLAYLTATVYYQVANFSLNPVFATVWISGVIAFSIGVFFYLKKVGEKNSQQQIFGNLHHHKAA